MKKLLLLLSLFILSGYTIDKKVNLSVVFIITTTTPYCGGANRTEVNDDISLKKKIAIGETFYIIKGKENSPNRKIIKSFKMGKVSSGCLYLAPGIYSVIDKFSFQKLIVDSNQFDITCMQQLWATPLFSFIVNKNKCETIVHNISLTCDYNKPCAKLNINIPMQNSVE